MTTLIRPDVRTDGGGGHHRAPTEPSRFAAWRSTWTVALRMARRDVRRHRGRSALVVVMVVVPTLLLSALATVAYTSEVSGVERIPLSMGSGQAVLEGPDPQRIRQGAEPTIMSSGPEAAAPVPGLAPDGSTTENADAVARLVGSPVAAFGLAGVRTTLDGRRTTLDLLALDGRVGLGEKLRLTSGRWPALPPADASVPAEVLVTPYGVERGVPTSGRLTVATDGVDRVLTVVGTATALEGWPPPGLVTAGPLTPGVSGEGGWIVLGDDPVTWEEQQLLNAHGFRVTSAAVLRDPPSAEELPAEVRDEYASDAARTRLLVGLGAAMLLITTTLLVGPAFAVSAARQRRTLALAASNGASTPVLRRTVLAQALVLGALSAAVGVVLGVGVAWLLVRWTDAFGGGYAPLDVRVGTLLGVGLCAVLSTVVAALVPARRLGRLDIVGVMRGQSVSPRPSPWLFLTGLVLVAAGSALLLTATGAVGRTGDGSTPVVLGQDPEVVVVAGAVALILGALLLVPLTLAGIGHLGGRLPTSLRMATRDLARHRARSAPSVAAILAAVAGLTFGLTGLESDTEQHRMEYLPSTIPGEAVVSPGYQEALDLDAVRSAVPDAVVSENRVVDTDDPWLDGQPTAPFRMTFVNVVPDGCTPEQALGYVAATGPDDAAIHRCARFGTTASTTTTVLVLPADELVRRLDLDATEAAAVRSGAVVLRGSAPPTVRLVRGTFAQDPTAAGPVDPDVRLEADRTVPVISVENTKESAGRMMTATMALAADTPVTTGWATTAHNATVRHADGQAVSQDEVDRLQERLGDEASVQVERGFQREDRLVVGILLGVFAVLILVVTLTSTALTLAEQQADQATLAALGATRGTRRVMAAAQAFLLAAVGCALGIAVGLVPGIAIAKPLTTGGWDPLTNQQVVGDGVLVLPWTTLLVLGVLVPVVAATLAAAGIRRSPSITRRAG